MFERHSPFSENLNMPQSYWSESTFCDLHQTPVRCRPAVSAKVYLVTNVGGWKFPVTLSGTNISPVSRQPGKSTSGTEKLNVNFLRKNCDDFFPKVVSKKKTPRTSSPWHISWAKYSKWNITLQAVFFRVWLGINLHLKLRFRMCSVSLNEMFASCHFSSQC